MPGPFLLFETNQIDASGELNGLQLSVILRPNGSADLLEPRSKNIFTYDGRTDKQTDEETDIASDNIRYILAIKNTKKSYKKCNQMHRHS